MKHIALLILLVLGTAASAVHAQEAENSVTLPRVVPTDGDVTPRTGIYLYDPSGNIAAIGQNDYIYDPMSRIKTGAVDRFGNVQSQTYSYDVYGNRTSDGVTNYSVDASTNRLTALSAQYDAVGNLKQLQPPLSMTARSYSYDVLGSLNREKVTLTGGDEFIAHVYTADDERYWSFRGGVSGIQDSWYSLRDLEDHVLREYSEIASEWSARDYVYRDGELLASYDTSSGETLHYSLDHLGTPRVVTDQDQVKIAEHTYFPFGAEYTDENPSDGSLHFTGHEQRDLDLLGENRGELDYMHARYYSSNLGRFLTVDPLSGLPNDVQSLNRYSYVKGNPVKFTDPSGLEFKCDGINGCTDSVTTIGDSIRGSGIWGSVADRPGSERLPPPQAPEKVIPCADRPSTCNQGYLECLSACIEAGDPGGIAKFAAAAFVPIPKIVPKALFGTRITKFAGGTRFTTWSSVGSQHLRLPAVNALRTVGHYASVAAVGYGLFLAGLETYCAGHCAANQCAY